MVNQIVSIDAYTSDLLARVLMLGFSVWANTINYVYTVGIFRPSEIPPDESIPEDEDPMISTKTLNYQKNYDQFFGDRILYNQLSKISDNPSQSQMFKLWNMRHQRNPLVMGWIDDVLTAVALWGILQFFYNFLCTITTTMTTIALLVQQKATLTQSGHDFIKWMFILNCTFFGVFQLFPLVFAVVLILKNMDRLDFINPSGLISEFFLSMMYYMVPNLGLSSIYYTTYVLDKFI
eukprot:403372766